jgi:23S rRNA (uracil1939-C5)-methyltransferase
MDEGRYSVGQEVELAIGGYTSEGDGVGKLDGAVFFVPGALAEETIRARIAVVKKNHYIAALASVTAPAAARCEPPCPLYRECGGCQLQHIAYPEQLLLKERRVRDALERIGGFSGIVIHPVRGMADPWRYRNKVVFTTGGEGSDPALGFLKAGSHQVVDIPDCLLADKAAAPIARTAWHAARECGNRHVEHVTIRQSHASGEILAVIETRGRPLAREEEIAERVTGADPRLVGVINTVAFDGRPRHLTIAGRDRITETLAGLGFAISAGTFFQVNSLQAEALYCRAAELVPANAATRVLDAYCGIGGFSLFMAASAGQVTGIERDGHAVRDANANARSNGITNVRFIEGDLEKRPPLGSADMSRCTDLVIDPPRRGLSPAFLKACVSLSFRRIIYASCDPATLARDCRNFREAGFVLRHITPFDLFPQTAHVECLAFLERT